MAKKSKYTRHRAIDCKLLNRSKSNPGCCKYMITIAEVDGTIHKQPAYGKDMQGALSRLIHKELTYKFERKIETSSGFIFLAWLIVMGTPTMLMDTTSPWFLAYIFGVVLILVAITVSWYSYIKKGEL